MRGWLKFIAACAVALVLTMGFRAVALTVYTVEGQALLPVLEQGDRVLVNRWSYGLRIGGEGALFSYSRLLRRPVSRGDLVVFDDPRDGADGVLICRCTALPGDTVSHGGKRLVAPSRAQCADADYYWLEALSTDNPLDSRTLGFVSEQAIIGRAVLVLYNHHPDSSIVKGWNAHRILLPL